MVLRKLKRFLTISNSCYLILIVLFYSVLKIVSLVGETKEGFEFRTKLYLDKENTQTVLVEQNVSKYRNKSILDIWENIDDKPIMLRTTLEPSLFIYRERNNELKYSTHDTILLPLMPFDNKTKLDDRITKQLEFKPEIIPTSNKIIFVSDNNAAASANRRIKSEGCMFNKCVFTNRDFERADAVLTNGGRMNNRRIRSDQIWIVSALESPMAFGMTKAPMAVNWTATYRRDSTLVTPYEKFVSFKNTNSSMIQHKDYMAKKFKMAAWFVSHCKTINNRKQYVEELQKYISVDIYGSCGNLTCSRRESDQKCFKFLKSDYKFYLAFENANCKDYITEKLYWNAYRNDIIPVVMGAHPDDYAAVAPPHSYIHVDHFTSPEHLASYLHKVASDRELYNSYFAWKGTGEFINTKFWCRLCALVHSSNNTVSWYHDIQDWWKGQDTCVMPKNGLKWATWRKYNSSSHYINNVRKLNHVS